MGPDNDRGNDPSHDELIVDCLESSATPAGEKQFRLLLEEPSFRRRVAEYAIDLGHLYDLGRQGMLERLPRGHMVAVLATRRRILAMAAAAVLLVVATAWLIGRDSRQQAELPGESGLTRPAVIQPLQQTTIARVTRVIGEVVRKADFDSPGRGEVTDGTSLRSGEVLRTCTSESLALLELVDGTVLVITGDTEVRCTVDRAQTRVALTEGELMARVASQPVGKPMLIETPVAQAEVLGTTLSLYANPDSTEVAVQEGKVRVRRFSDGRWIDLVSGQCVVAAAESDLVPLPLAPVSSLWEEDFEEGLPCRWRAGHLVREALPSGSFGAVRQEEQGDSDGPFRIATAREWARGLFRIEADTHLNFTYKLKARGGFHIRLYARPDFLDATIADCYEYRNRELVRVARNRWRTVSIPLTYFHGFRRGLTLEPFDGTLSKGDLVIMLGFGSPARDPGLVIDRIWVTREAPDGADLLGESER